MSNANREVWMLLKRNYHAVLLSRLLELYPYRRALLRACEYNDL